MSSMNPMMSAVSNSEPQSHDIAVLWEVDAEDGDPDSCRLETWAKQVLDHLEISPSEVAIKVVTSAESQQLNASYRDINKPTNVLSFPMTTASEALSGVTELPLLGDLAICAEVVRQEADAQGKTAEAHFAHMVVHGVLHLLGFDHQTDHEAEAMEQIERGMLLTMGYGDPYHESE